MAFTVAAWNIQEGLAKVDQPEQPPQLVEAIKGLDKDVVVLSDAYWLDNPLHRVMPEIATLVLEQFAKAGYAPTTAEYDDSHSWPGRYMTVLSRLALTSGGPVRLGGRNGVELKLQDPDTGVDVRLIGSHFYDRSEEWRLLQVTDIVDGFDLSEPTVVAGDLNAMHRKGRARLLRSRPSREMASRLLHPAPRNTMEEHLGRLNMAERLTDMADGTTLRRLRHAGLYDVDRRRRSTMPAGFPLVQLDHILATEHLHPSSFRVHHATGVSDHRPISVTLET